MGARAAAHEALGETLRRRRPLEPALDAAIAARALMERDAGFARAIANEAMRRFGQLEDIVRRFVPRAPPPHRAGPTLEILYAGACELLFLDVPAHAAVDGANRLAADDAKAVHFKPLINAALRRIAREGHALVNEQDGERLNTPDWMWTRWCETYGEENARAIARVHARNPPLDIVGRHPSDDLRKLAAEDLPGGVLRLGKAGNVTALPGFAEGAFWVQDFAATLPVRLFGDVRGRRVIDLCAAPGGKTAQLAFAGADVVSVDNSPDRVARLRENLFRLKLESNFVTVDIRDFAPKTPADCVLLDAPCTSTGTIRRHPELPWIRSAADIAMNVENAGALLDAAASMVAVSGTLVFAVCSLEPEEGAGQVVHFLCKHDEFERRPIAPSELFGLRELISEEGDLRTLPCHLAESGGMDGFYAARLKRVR
jgi:16S rRNA (cytosine967-C5)-methyltransferase